MLEEGVVGMERKGTSRPSSAPVKSNGSVDRKNDPSTASKNYNRFNQRRDGGGVRAPQPENANRRPFSQKNRTSLDKRPRQRGSYGNRQREEVVEAGVGETPESRGSHKFPRAANGNHLVNVQFAPRNEVGFSMRPLGHSRRRVRVTYNKERYLQANCQFVVKNTGDYARQAVDPDALVDWNLVEQVRTFSHEPPSCPICLHEPSAGKITRCGHVYCWSCILHYLSYDDKSWRKCPICFEAVHQSDLRSVRVVQKQEHRVGDTITLQLMKREKNATYAVPLKHWEDRQGRPQNVDDTVNTEFAKVLVASAEQIKTNVIEHERRELAAQMNGAENEEVVFIISAQDLLKERESTLQGTAQANLDNAAALEKLQMASSYNNGNKSSGNGNGRIPEARYPAIRRPLKMACNRDKAHRVHHTEYADAFDELELEPEDLSDEEVHSDAVHSDAASEDHDSLDSFPSSPRGEFEAAAFLVPDAIPELTEAAEPAQADSSVSDSPPPDEVFSFIPHDGEGGATMTCEEAIENLAMPEQSPNSQPRKGRNNVTKKDFYFYQACDGQHIYLHSINARCMDHQYGGLEFGPPTITAKIIDKEVAFMTQNIRGRTRFLSHLPLTCEFQVLELDLGPPLVSEQTLQEFAGALQERVRRRRQAKREDKQRARKERIREQRSYGFYPNLPVPLDSPFHFPDVVEDRQRMSSSDAPFSSSPASSDSADPDASVARVPKVKSEGALSDLAQPGTIKCAYSGAVKQPAKPAWGPRSAAQPALPVRQEPAVLVPRVRHDTDESDNEDRVPVPDYKKSYEASMDKFLSALTVKDETKGQGAQGAQESNGQSAPGGKKKKKAGKGQVLFSTTMQRR